MRTKHKKGSLVYALTYLYAGPATPSPKKELGIYIRPGEMIRNPHFRPSNSVKEEFIFFHEIYLPSRLKSYHFSDSEIEFI
jgi:hypothetical protein